MSVGIVIIGAGQAGGRAALLLAELKYGGSVTLVGAEPFPPYERPPLSKKMLAEPLAGLNRFGTRDGTESLENSGPTGVAPRLARSQPSSKENQISPNAETDLFDGRLVDLLDKRFIALTQ